MAELPWSKFFWSDWEADQGLRLCSLAAQGLWMRILCVCAKGEPRGFLAINGQPLDATGVARLCGITAAEASTLMDELELNGVFSRDRRKWIYSRRMIKDAKKSAEGKKSARKRWSQSDEKQSKKSGPIGGATEKPNAKKPEARGQSPDIGDGKKGAGATDPADNPKGDGVSAQSARAALGRLFEVAGPGLADPAKHSALHTSSGEVLRWLKAGCDLERDIVPVIEGLTANPRGSPIKSWAYFTTAVLEETGRNRHELTIPEPDHEELARTAGHRSATSNRSGGGRSRGSSIADICAGAYAELPDEDDPSGR